MSKEQIKAARRKQAGNYAFLAPAAIIYLSVIVIPLIYSIYISFHKWNEQTAGNTTNCGPWR